MNIELLVAVSVLDRTLQTLILLKSFQQFDDPSNGLEIILFKEEKSLIEFLTIDLEIGKISNMTQTYTMDDYSIIV